ncbi:hypothetical protein [Roseovarius sp. D22-M7]|uniref:hypothetical protein n=1 Tax=Roseovarius sp. D22-M7 TaxID=3127116 RepID=UPI0030102091
MISEDQKLWEMLVEHANAHNDRHLTVMKFTTNWRGGWYQPGEREGIQELSEVNTFAEAARAALQGKASAGLAVTHKSCGNLNHPPDLALLASIRS